jgi:hypothetical protein
MTSKSRNLFIIISFLVLFAACSGGPSIQSVKDDKVTISAAPEDFLEAYEMAQKECKINNKSASYIADQTSSLKTVAFDCIGEEVDTVAEAEAETQPEIDTTSEEVTTQ